MSIIFTIGICPDCGREHGEEIIPFLLMSGWIKLEESTETRIVVELNPLMIDALFRTNAACETVGIIEEMLFNDSYELFLSMNDEDDDNSDKKHIKPLLSIVKTDD